MPAGLPAKMAVLLRAPAGLIIRVTLDELMTHKHSDYMHWSKTQSRARFNLATSGVASFPLRELPVELDTLEINGYDGYGYPLLLIAVASHHGVEPDFCAEYAGTYSEHRLPVLSIVT